MPARFSCSVSIFERPSTHLHYSHYILGRYNRFSNVILKSYCMRGILLLQMKELIYVFISAREIWLTFL